MNENVKNFLITPSQEIIRNQSRLFNSKKKVCGSCYGNFFQFNEVPEINIDPFLNPQRRNILTSTSAQNSTHNSAHSSGHNSAHESSRSSRKSSRNQSSATSDTEDENLNNKSLFKNVKKEIIDDSPVDISNLTLSNLFNLTIQGKFLAGKENEVEIRNPHETKNLLSSESSKNPLVILVALDSPKKPLYKEVDFSVIRPKPFNYRDYNGSVFAEPPDDIIKAIQITKAQIKHPELMKQEMTEGSVFCEICQVFLSNPTEAEEHKQGQTHIQNLNNYDIDKMMSEINDFCAKIDEKRELKHQLKQQQQNKSLDQPELIENTSNFQSPTTNKHHRRHRSIENSPSENEKREKFTEKVRFENDAIFGENTTKDMGEINSNETEKIQTENLEAEEIKKEMIEREKGENERIEREKHEKERIEREKHEKEKIEKEKLEKERIEREKREKEKIEREKYEKERIEKEKYEKERTEKEKREKERIEREKYEKERIEKEKYEKERIEREKREKEMIENEKRKKEIEKIENEKRDKEKIEREKSHKENQNSFYQNLLLLQSRNQSQTKENSENEKVDQITGENQYTVHTPPKQNDHKEEQINPDNQLIISSNQQEQINTEKVEIKNELKIYPNLIIDQEKSIQSPPTRINESPRHMLNLIKKIKVSPILKSKDVNKKILETPTKTEDKKQNEINTPDNCENGKQEFPRPDFDNMILETNDLTTKSPQITNNKSPYTQYFDENLVMPPHLSYAFQHFSQKDHELNYSPSTLCSPPRIRHKIDIYSNEGLIQPRINIDSLIQLSPQKQVDHYLNETNAMKEIIQQPSPYNSESMKNSDIDSLSDMVDSEISTLQSELDIEIPNTDEDEETDEYENIDEYESNYFSDYFSNTSESLTYSSISNANDDNSQKKLAIESPENKYDNNNNQDENQDPDVDAFFY